MQVSKLAGSNRSIELTPPLVAIARADRDGNNLIREGKKAFPVAVRVFIDFVWWLLIGQSLFLTADAIICHRVPEGKEGVEGWAPLSILQSVSCLYTSLLVPQFREEVSNWVMGSDNIQ